MKLPHFKKKYIAGALAAGLIMGAGGLAAAYFGVAGSGTGAAKTGHATDVTIQSVGPGYDSTISPSTPDPYSASQCLGCGYALGELGDVATLTMPVAPWAQLISVTVPLVNFGSTTSETVTLYLYTGPNGTYTFTRHFTVAPGTSPTQKVTNVTFTFATQGVFVDPTFKYGISLSAPTVGINVALVKNSTQVSIGSSPTASPYTKKSGTFKQTTVLAPWTNYIPAAEFNIVGGDVGPLYPGAPATPVVYAVTNHGVTGAHLATVDTAFGTMPAHCTLAWFTIYGTQPHTVNRTFAPGLTVVTNTGTTIAMLTSGTTQSSCASTAVPLTFTGAP